MIHVENLHKHFKKAIKEPGLKGSIKALFKPKYDIVKAVDGISFDVASGEIIGFIGPNGAGKSTVIKMLTGILTPSEGFCRINGFIPTENRKAYVKEIGVVFGQRTQLWWDLALRETYMVLKEIYDISDEDYTKRMAFLNEVLDLEGFITSPVRTLSLGQRMRADIAAALLHNPKVLFLDEPTVGLDPKQIIELREVISGLAKERTVILSTHIMQEVLAVCDSYIIINKGKVAAHGKLDEISGAACRAWQLRIKRIYSEIEPVLAQIDGLEKIVNMGSFERGTNDVTVMAKDGCDIRESIFKACSTAGFSILSFSAVAQSLEELFLQVIRDESVEKNMFSQESKRQGVGV